MPPDAAELEERREQVVVAGVEHEPGVEDRARLVEIGRRLLDRDDVRALAREAGEQRRLEVEDHALRDVVDDHRQAVRGRRRWRAKWRARPSAGGLL